MDQNLKVQKKKKKKEGKKTKDKEKEKKGDDFFGDFGGWTDFQTS